MTTTICWVDRPTYITPAFIEGVSRLGRFSYHEDKPDKAELIRRLSACDVAIVEWSRVDAEVLERAGRCRYILLPTTGYDFVDVDAAKKRGVVVSNCPEYSSQAVAEWTMACLALLDRRILPSDRAAREGERHLYPPFLGRQWRGATLGLIGTGAIGRALAGLGSTLGMDVVGCGASGRPVEGVRLLGMEDVFAASDFVSIQVPSTAATRGLIGRRLLEAAKKRPCLASCSREAVLDLDALHAALAGGRLAGAALDDVVAPSTHPLFSLPNVIVTTGIAWHTREAREANLDYMLKALTSYAAGRPLFVI